MNTPKAYRPTMEDQSIADELFGSGETDFSLLFGDDPDAGETLESVARGWALGSYSAPKRGYPGETVPMRTPPVDSRKVRSDAEISAYLMGTEKAYAVACPDKGRSVDTIIRSDGHSGTLVCTHGIVTDGDLGIADGETDTNPDSMASQRAYSATLLGADDQSARERFVSATIARVGAMGAAIAAETIREIESRCDAAIPH